jgi:diaminohydroxyphosphoribosylaminopyrimidine deaminase/5-amino-6-(5-phosphoribosylamino)uracil reductase
MSNGKMDVQYMKRCFDLASKAGKEVKGNPKVGAVLVYKERIIGEGFHKASGGPHAEVNCINSVSPDDQSLIPLSTLYVSLEPCCHHGKTPPCTSLILKHGIKDVRISVFDPSEKVKGKGVKILEEHGVKVSTGILSDIGREVIKPFAVRQKKKRPFIILKIVKSSDHYIGVPGKKIWLTSRYTDVLTHKWRSETDGILIGTNTAINDRPSLTTRNYPGPDPVKLFIDRQHRININDHPSFMGDYIYFSYQYRADIPEKRQFIISKGSELESIMHDLLDSQIYSVIIEGGSKMIRSFYNEGLWDEARIITTPTVLKEGVKAVNIEGILIKKYKIDKDLIQIIQNPYS